MKILTVIDNFPPESSGGSEHVALNLCLGLQAHGHEVVVLTTTQNPARTGETIHEGLRVVRIFSKYHNRLAQSYLGVWNPIIKRAFLNIIKTEDPDIVHFHTIHSHISYAAFKWTHRATQAKIFFTAHDVISFAYTRLTHFIDPQNPVCKKTYDYRMTFPRLWHQAGRMYNPFRRILIRHYLRNAHKIFTVSEALRDAFTQNGILNTMTVYNGIDISRLDVSEQIVSDFKDKNDFGNKKIILFTGRSMSAKGLIPLIESLPQVVARVPNTLLVMAIKGSYAEHIRQVLLKKGLLDHAVIVGHLSGNDLSAMYHLSDVVAVPSICFDSAPLVNLEAMAVKKPVVGTCFGGTPEIVLDGVTGFIVNPYNKEILADRISKLLEEESLAREFGLRGLEVVRTRFTIDHQVEATLAAYQA